MARKKTTFFCQNCGTQSAKWVGKCPSCGEWNTYVEEVIDTGERSSFEGHISGNKPKPILLDEVASHDQTRISVGDQELDRVLGGGIVPGSLVLIGGEPGIGKSTLLLQAGMRLAGLKVLYVSGEESEQQLKMRAERIGAKQEAFFVLTETNIESIFAAIKGLNPELLVIDSIQTMYSDMIESSPGSVSQIRHCAMELMKYAKSTAIPVFLIGHITKDGNIAGPKILEHMVDTVIQFEGDQHLSYRMLRTTKNRFGSTSELGIYEMQHNGLRQVSNPSEILLSQRDEALAGVSIAASLEGNRPLLVEIQSLVSHAAYGVPQRSCTGYDTRRLSMLLAVLEKRGGYRLGNQDVFLNIAGGLRIDDPAIDLAVIASIVSSLEERPISQKICFAAEVGLGGEIRAINRIENRISEAEKLGFEQIFISSYYPKGLNLSRYNIRINHVNKLHSVFKLLF